MQEINWEKYREQDGTLDLDTIYVQCIGGAYHPITANQRMFFQRLQGIRPVKSRQVAALALAMAMSLVGCSREEGVFQLTGRGYEVKEVRPGLTCVFTNGEDAGVSCVQGSYPATQ